jgi:hypothetical protein
MLPMTLRGAPPLGLGLLGTTGHGVEIDARLTAEERAAMPADRQPTDLVLGNGRWAHQVLVEAALSALACAKSMRFQFSGCLIGIVLYIAGLFALRRGLAQALQVYDVDRWRLRVDLFGI